MYMTEAERRFVDDAREHFEKHGTIGVETKPDGSAEIAPRVWVTDERLQQLMEHVL